LAAKRHRDDLEGRTNSYHASRNLQNTVLNARNPFSGVRPKTIMNNWFIYRGPPVLGLQGKDKTFFFIAAEAPKSAGTGCRLQCPSVVCNGDLSYSAAIKDPNTGLPFAGNQIPSDRITSLSKNVLQYLFPLPNTGAPNAIANNYVKNFATPISSNQGDARIDRNINSRQTTFARFTWKQRSVFAAPGAGSVSGSPLLGTFSQPETDYGLTVATIL
jgi:hypothetical protein